MSESLRIAGIDDVPPGSAIEVTAAGRVFAVYNVEGEIHVLDGICPHAGGPLGQGALEGNVITCPWHGWQFDVTTGRHCLNVNLCHMHYAARIEGTDVVVDVE